VVYCFDFDNNPIASNIVLTYVLHRSDVQPIIYLIAICLIVFRAGKLII